MALLTRQTQDGRQLLREILEGPIRFMPDGEMYRFHGKAALGKLLAGAASNVLCGVPGGFERTLDHDFQGKAA